MIADLLHHAPGHPDIPAAPPAWSDATAAEAWVSRCDEDAAAWLVRTHGPLVLRIVRSRLFGSDGVEDAVQSIWMAAFRALGRYDSTRPLAAWLSRIALNECLDIIRARSRRRVFSTTDLGLERIEDIPGAPASTSPDVERISAEREALGFDLLACLPARDRDAFSLYHSGNLSSAEVAALMGIRPGHLRLRVFRAQQVLRRRVLARGVS